MLSLDNWSKRRTSPTRKFSVVFKNSYPKMDITIVLKKKGKRENKGTTKHNKILKKVNGLISLVVKLFSELMVQFFEISRLIQVHPRLAESIVL